MAEGSKILGLGTRNYEDRRLWFSHTGLSGQAGSQSTVSEIGYFRSLGVIYYEEAEPGTADSDGNTPSALGLDLRSSGKAEQPPRLFYSTRQHELTLKVSGVTPDQVRATGLDGDMTFQEGRFTESAGGNREHVFDAKLLVPFAAGQLTVLLSSTEHPWQVVTT